MRFAALLAALVVIGPVHAQDSKPLNFQCKFSLLVSQNPQRFSAPTPVEIQFHKSGDVIDDIRIIDVGGILFPSGNIKVVKTDEFVSMKAVDMPSERPGIWRGFIKDGKYNFDLEADGKPGAAHFILTTEARNANGEHVVIWNATNQPEGMPEPVKGTGIGYCIPKAIEGAIQ